jgi:hypothetical protein
MVFERGSSTARMRPGGADFLAQAADRGGDRGRVVGEVVVHGHALHHAAHFHAPLDALEARQRFDRLGPGGTPTWRAAAMAASALVRLWWPLRSQCTVPCSIIEEDVEAGTARMFDQAPVCAFGCAEGFLFAPAAALEHAAQRGFVAVHDQAADAGHGAHQVVELGLDGADIREDVGVIVFQVVQHRRLGVVMHELGALVEEGGVVLVGFDHEEVGVGVALQARRDAEVHRHAADQEARRITGIVEDPGQHRGGRGLAVGTGHGQHPFITQDMVADPLRTRYVAQAAVQDFLDQRITTRHHVPDHIQVGIERHLVRAVTLDQLDALGFELGAHRRIDVGVAPGDAVAGLLGQDCQSRP